jgi:hypothetical protein
MSPSHIANKKSSTVGTLISSATSRSNAFFKYISTKPQSQPKNATVAKGKGRAPRKSTPSADNTDLMSMLKNLRQNDVVSNQPNQSNKYAIALHTAQVIADNGSHPRQKDVRWPLK